MVSTGKHSFAMAWVMAALVCSLFCAGIFSVGCVAGLLVSQGEHAVPFVCADHRVARQLPDLGLFFDGFRPFAERLFACHPSSCHRAVLLLSAHLGHDAHVLPQPTAVGLARRTRL